MGLTINNFRDRNDWTCTTQATPNCTNLSGDAILARHALRLAPVLRCRCLHRFVADAPAGPSFNLSWLRGDGANRTVSLSSPQPLFSHPPFRRLGFEDKGMWEPFVGLACLALGYNLAGYAVLRFSKKKFLPLTASVAKKRA